MSDEVEGRNAESDSVKEIELAFDDAVSFFESVCKDAQCTSCGGDRWEIPTAKGNNDLCLIRKSGIKQNNASVYNLTIECLICGNVRTHRVGKILEWLNAQKPNGDGDE